MKKFYKLITFITTIFVISPAKAKSTDAGMQYAQHDKARYVITSSSPMGSLKSELGTLELVAKNHIVKITDNFSEENIYRLMKESAEKDIPLFAAH